MKKRNFICDFNGCNRVFTQSNHLKQHKNKLHFANSSRNDEFAKIIKDKQDNDIDLHWEHELYEKILKKIFLSIILYRL